MKNISIVLITFGVGMGLGFFVSQKIVLSPPISLVTQPTPLPTPLTAYSFEKLRAHTFSPVPITFGKVLKEDTDFTMQLFSYTFSPNPEKEETKTVTGVAHLPKKDGVYPVILMLRGYIPQEKYTEGAGTNPSASVFARHGFITLAPDFLGFGGSDPRGNDEYENRFQTYTTALSLFSSLSSLNSSLDASYSGKIKIDPTKIGIWGHSNGGHIALSLLAISETKDPTVLWAPVSKSFPYSVLAYTDEEDDGGKLSRQSLANFEKIYDTSLFDPAHYYSLIQAPIQIHQGTVDEEVPYWWSDELAKTLKKNGLSVDYHKYPGSDHNLRPAWNDVVTKSIEFYTNQFGK